MGNGYWNARDYMKARANACTGEFRPKKYTVTVDDTHAQWRYELAARALWGQTLPSFFSWCVEYVIRHHRLLAPARRAIREREKELRRQKKERLKAARAAYRANPSMYLGEPPPMPKPRRRKRGKRG
jgi:hypothetical protein